MKLSRELWRQVEPLLTTALGLEASARAAWLAGLDASHPGAAPFVRRMLETHERAERSRELETLPKRAPPESRGSLHAAGESVGPFALVRPLGRGGMGEVWLARQADGRVEREVALKLPALHEEGGVLRERFRRERDILARLEHPNIARLYDAGVTQAGQPWLAMEFVQGQSLSERVASRALPVRERLALFRQVLAAVAHAHRHLVVHRDLKPANILIDAPGQVKLLDFGIAKLVDPGEATAAAADLTRLGGRVMTLRYAAPEQVAGGPITTATDIYALGVVLHELLTGLAPYRAVREGKPLTEAMLLQEPESLPSRLAITATAARECGLPSPRQLARLVSGDLDAIVLKAMRRDPADRYASVEALDEDILAHLGKRPVKARAGTWRYLAGRFAARNRFPLTMAAAILAMLAASVLAIDRERRVAVAQKERAERHFDSVRHLANALLFDVHDQIANLPGATLAKQTLLENASKYLARLAPEAGDDPDFRRELAGAYLRLGNIQGQYGAQNIGKPQEALASFDQALALLAPAVGADLSGKAVPSADLIVRVYRQKSQLLYSLDRLDDATAAARAGHDIAGRLAGSPGATPRHRLSHARMVVEYTRLQSRQGDRSIRLRGLEQALALTHAVRASLPADAPAGLREETLEDIAWMSSEMGHYLRSTRDPALKRRAIGYFREALAIRQEALANAPANAAKQRSIIAHHTFIGLTHTELGEAREALDYLGKGTASMRALLAADPGNVQYRRDMVFTLAALAMAQVSARQFEEALATIGQAREHHARLPEAVRAMSSNREAEADLLVAEAESQFGLANGRPPPGDRAARLAQAHRDLVAAGRIFADIGSKPEKGMDLSPSQAKVRRLLGEVESDLRRSGEG